MTANRTINLRTRKAATPAPQAEVTAPVVKAPQGNPVATTTATTHTDKEPTLTYTALFFSTPQGWQAQAQKEGIFTPILPTRKAARRALRKAIQKLYQ